MSEFENNGTRFTSGSGSGGAGAEPPMTFPKHKRLLAALVAEKVVDRLGLLSPSELWLMADEICKLDEELCRRMAYALGKRVCDSEGDEPR
jgi:hypothetical protein